MESAMEMDALFDSGSTYGHMDEDVAKKLGLLTLPIEYESTLGDGRVVKVKPALGEITIRGCRWPMIIGVKERGAYPLTIGYLQMQAMGIKLDPKAERVIMDECRRPLA